MGGLSGDSSLRKYFGRVIERGAPWLSPLARVYSASIRVEREIAFSPTTRVIAIGGATLGGSGKTPLALSCAKYMHSKGAGVAIIGHAYRAHPSSPQIVKARSEIREVGDEARMLARALGDEAGAPRVVVAGKRQDAVRLAEQFADIVILDGVLQTAPRRATLSLLAVNRDAPWGSKMTLPAGDLRAPKHVLEAACDAITAIDIPLKITGDHAPSLKGARVGLITAIARGDRVAKDLARHGAIVAHHLAFADHGPIDSRRLLQNMRAARDVEYWITTPKCREHLVHLNAAEFPAPLFTLAGIATLDEATRVALDHVLAHYPP